MTGSGARVDKPVRTQTSASTPGQARCLKEFIVTNLHVSVNNSLLRQIGNRMGFDTYLETMLPPNYNETWWTLDVEMEKISLLRLKMGKKLPDIPLR
jgi:hypothetical protein